MDISETAVWIAFFALLTSIIALVTSVIVTYQNWKHNRLSVLPHVDMHRSTGINDCYFAVQSTGAGPAIINQITVTIEDRTFDLSTYQGMKDFSTGPGKDLVGKLTIIDDGVFILPNDYKKILEFNDENYEVVALFMDRLSFKIKYTSVYGKKFEEHLLVANDHTNSDSSQATQLFPK